MVSAREALAAHLCEEFDEDFRPLKGAAWPENEADDGKREGGYIAIQPKHVQARAKEAAARILAFLAASPSSPASGARVKTGIYVASKVKHAEMWRDLRSFEKMPIISTWIDELYPDDMDGLWQRCISEASNAQAFLILRRPDEVLKGAWIELGAALASGVPVYAVGIEEYTVAKDKRIRHFPNLVEARAAIRSALGEHP